MNEWMNEFVPILAREALPTCNWLTMVVPSTHGMVDIQDDMIASSKIMANSKTRGGAPDVYVSYVAETPCVDTLTFLMPLAGWRDMAETRP